MSDRTRPTLSRSTAMAETREGDFLFWTLWGAAWEEAEPFSVHSVLQRREVGADQTAEREVYSFKEKPWCRGGDR